MSPSTPPKPRNAARFLGLCRVPSSSGENLKAFLFLPAEELDAVVLLQVVLQVVLGDVLSSIEDLDAESE